MDDAKKRWKPSDSQKAFLEAFFVICNLPNRPTVEALARTLCIGARQVRIWFQNRRQRVRRGQGDSVPLDADVVHDSAQHLLATLARRCNMAFDAEAEDAPPTPVAAAPSPAENEGTLSETLDGHSLLIHEAPRHHILGGCDSVPWSLSALSGVMAAPPWAMTASLPGSDYTATATEYSTARPRGFAYGDATAVVTAATEFGLLITGVAPQAMLRASATPGKLVGGIHTSTNLDCSSGHGADTAAAFAGKMGYTRNLGADYVAPGFPSNGSPGRPNIAHYGAADDGAGADTDSSVLGLADKVQSAIVDGMTLEEVYAILELA